MGIELTGGKRLGIDLLKAHNPHYATKLEELASNIAGRMSLMAQLLDQLKGRIHIDTDIQWSILGFSGPGWVVLCVSGLDIPCPPVAKEFVVELFKYYKKFAPEVAVSLFEDVKKVIEDSAT